MKEDGQNVKITLHNEIKRDDEIEQYELTVFGKYYKRGNNEFLKYEEAQEEGTVKTILKWNPEFALVMRSGAVSMRLEHRENKTTHGSYQHPYGTLSIEAYTSEIQSRVEEHTHTVQLQYDLSMQQSFIGTYKMTFTFEEV